MQASPTLCFNKWPFLSLALELIGEMLSYRYLIFNSYFYVSGL